MSTLKHDLKFALRTLRRSRGFAAMAIATIAVAIGANTAMFSFVNGLLLNPLPYPDPDRIVRVLERRPDGGVNGISTLNYLDWAQQNTVFEYLSPQGGWRVTLTGEGEPTDVAGAQVGADYFRITGAVPALGRTFAEGEDEPGRDHVVVLSHTAWGNRFGADPGVVGRSILLDGEPYTVVGVLAEGDLYDRSRAEIWKPLAFQPDNMTRNFHWFGAVGKLKPNVTLEAARAEMDVVGARISEQYPDSNKGWGVAVDPLADQIAGPQVRAGVLTLFVATAFVLLIGVANLANLALARGLARGREIAVRASLGAGRWRLARQFLTESLLLAAVGGILGIGLGYALMRWVRTLIPPFSLPAEVDVSLDTTVLLFALGVMLLTGLLFGLAPAVQATRTSLTDAMKSGGPGTTPGSPGRRMRAGLVVAEVALAFVLLFGTGLLMRTLSSLLAVDPGFDPTNVLTASLRIPQKEYPDAAELNAYLDTVRGAVEAVPGVREAAMTSALPLQGWGYGMPFQIAGRDNVDRANRSGGFFKIVSPAYFQTLGIKVIAGRGLSPTNRAGAPPVALINETMAKRDFAGEDPVGQRVLVQQIVPGRTELGDEIAWEIVGVVADERINNLQDTRSAGLYVTMEQSPVYAVSLVVRAAIEPSGLEGAVRQAVSGVNKDQAIANVRTLQQITDQSLVANRIQSILLGIFAACALILAAVGIYGVIAYAVTQRTHEMGIRAAIGASAADLRAMLFTSGMRLVGMGLLLGLIGALAVGRLLTSMLFGVGARDPLTATVVGLVLGLVAAVACLVPAQLATKVNPMGALREQ